MFGIGLILGCGIPMFFGMHYSLVLYLILLYPALAVAESLVRKTIPPKYEIKREATITLCPR